MCFVSALRTTLRLIKRGMMVAAGVVFFALYSAAKQMGWKMISTRDRR
jgi:protease-4